ncbi:MAG: FecR family protein, partial [Spirochaetaceae bacterium]|nr:FecR family protein [Spirochaetaceae bacterium]
MKRLSLAVLLVVTASAALAVPVATLGTIDYAEGSVTINRAGKIIADPNIEDAIQSGDLIKTGSDGMVVIALGRNTGMSGTLTVRSRSSLYLKLESAGGQPKTSVDVLAGSIASKVKKLAASPSMDVVTKVAVMAVRGTEFGVTYSVNDATLITCAEGRVSVYKKDDEGFPGAIETAVMAGKAVERREGAEIRFLPVAVSSIEKFTSDWITSEIDAFRSDPIGALTKYEELYAKKRAEFLAAYEPFQQSSVLKKWLEEDRT